MEKYCGNSMLALVGYLICGAILFAKHRELHKKIRFHHVVRKFSLSNPVHLWQLRMALGVSLVLSAGQIWGMERFMWIGFACASLLSQYPYSHDTTLRFRQRIVGAVAGSCLFFILYQLTPEALHSLLGPLGGLCLGFCTDYRYKTAMNCFGALMLGAGIYGVQQAVLLRILNTFLGVAFGLLFALLFHKVVAAKFLPAPEVQPSCAGTPFLRLGGRYIHTAKTSKCQGPALTAGPWHFLCRNNRLRPIPI